MTGLKVPSPDELKRMAAEAIYADDDHIVAKGDDLAWLVAQLACWPTRVDQRYTTNLRFLLLSAAATLLAANERRAA